ncbi:Acyl-CoA reductase [Bryocella elongata]|uniref:Aldehyde dehydrogenase n=1 Tax=Bryocella elongata TaxID=863522 RepID=A0A1H5VYN6_9BACT|nr:aldehyde dehydrogenase family protein [Bryocella elongata]SEF92374.1 Acyl-CoA reductase [Bryocella elongata]
MLTRIDAARSAQQRWAALSVRERARRLLPLRRVLAARMDEVIATISSEVGKPPLDALSGDVMVVLEHLRWCEKNAARVLATRRVGAPALLYTGCTFTESEEPYGVALVLAPWNYPLQLSLVPATTALFAGNSVMLKCSEFTPKLAALIEDCVHQAGLPEGLLSVSAGGANEGKALLDAGPDLVFFTGSSHVGRSVAERAAARLIPCVLELGGKDPCLVFASAPIERAIEGVCYAAFSNAGQVCVGAKRLYVEQSIFESFLSRFVARARQLRIGSDLASDMGQVRIAPLRESLAAWVADAIAGGATLHTPFDPTSENIGPLVFTSVARDSHIRGEETFGPIVWLEPFDGERDAMARANDSPFALAASIFTGDSAQADRIASQLNAGGVSINDAIRQVGNPVAAFGGNRASGYGRYHGECGLRAFSRVKTRMITSGKGTHERHWFPASAKTFRELQAVLQLRHGTGSLAGRLKALVSASLSK